MSDSGPEFDVTSIVRTLGGATVLHRKLAVLGYGETPSVETIRKWMRRNSVTSSWLAVLMALAKAEGRPLDLYQFLDIPR